MNNVERYIKTSKRRFFRTRMNLLELLADRSSAVFVLASVLLGIIAGWISIEKNNSIFSPLMRGISVALLASPLLAYLYERFQRSVVRAATEESVRQAFESQSKLLYRINAAGITGAYETIDPKTISRKIAGAKNIDLINTWMPASSQYLSAIDSAVENNARIRILLADPGSRVAIQRGYDLDIPPEDVEARILSNIRSFSKINDIDIDLLLSRNSLIRDRFQDNPIQLKFYKSIPAIPMYRIDGAIIFGIFWSHHEAISGPSISVRESSVFYHELTSHFENVWSSADYYPSRSPRLLNIDRYNFSHMYYLSHDGDGRSFWRYLEFNISELANSLGNQHADCRYCSPDDDEVAYILRGDIYRNTLVISKIGVEKADDFLVASFPFKESPINSGGTLAGSISHLDWGEDVRIDPVLIFSDIRHEEFKKENPQQDELGMGDVVIDSEFSQALHKKWNEFDLIAPEFAKSICANE